MKIYVLNNLSEIIPHIDMVTFQLKCSRIYGGWIRWRDIVEDYAGARLRYVPKERNGKKITRRRHWVCDSLGIRLTRPNDHGSAAIFFAPNSKNLLALQDMTAQYLECERDKDLHYALKVSLSLSRIEWAFDIFFNHAHEQDAQTICKRLAYHLLMRNGRNVFTRYFNKDYDSCLDDFASYDEYLACKNRTADGSTNGNLTIYMQCFSDSDKELLREKLSYNPFASLHTTIYPKMIDDIWFTRIEMRWGQKKIKSDLKFLYNNLPGILDVAKQYRFSDFWKICTIDYAAFYRDIFSKYSEKIKRNNRFVRLLQNAKMWPVSDQLRVMREMARRFGNEYFRRSIPSYCKTITANDALNQRIPRIALPECRERLQDLVKIGPKQYKHLSAFHHA